MSNISAVRTAYETEIAKLTDPISIAEANVVLDNLIFALTTSASMVTQSNQSYTVAQRTVTKRNQTDAQNSVNEYRGQLRRLLYGNSVVPDLSGDETSEI